MLKNILCILTFLIVDTASVHAQLLVPSPTDTLTLDTTTVSQAESVMIISLHNTSTSDSLLKWRVIYNTFPHTWTMGYCDPGVCLSPIPTASVPFTMSPGVTGLMQLDIQPTSGSACGNLQVLVWAPADSANTAVILNYKACVTGTPNGISETEAGQISFYPNPVREQLKITLPQIIDNGQIDIFNLLGTKVFSQSIGSRETTKDIDLGSLSTGLYVARISQNGKVLTTRKFTKED